MTTKGTALQANEIVFRHDKEDEHIGSNLLVYNQKSGVATVGDDSVDGTVLLRIADKIRASRKREHLDPVSRESREFVSMRMSGSEIEAVAGQVAWEQLRMFYKDKHGDDEQAYLASAERIQALRTALDS